jgi:hypothetical protein
MVHGQQEDTAAHSPEKARLLRVMDSGRRIRRRPLIMSLISGSGHQLLALSQADVGRIIGAVTDHRESL